MGHTFLPPQTRPNLSSNDTHKLSRFGLELEKFNYDTHNLRSLCTMFWSTLSFLLQVWLIFVRKFTCESPMFFNVSTTCALQGNTMLVCRCKTIVVWVRFHCVHA